MVYQIRRWLPGRTIVLVGDGTYATAELCWLCYKQEVSLVSRIRSSARLFALPPIYSGAGRPPQKGKRLSTPRAILRQDGDHWQRVNVRWYGGGSKVIEMFSMSCIWHVQGYAPLPVRLVFVRDSIGSFESITLVSTGLDLTPETIARTTPVLLALYTLVVMMAEQLMCHGQVIKHQTSWYSKESLTFSNLLRAVRHHLWLEGSFLGFDGWGNHLKNMPPEILTSIAEMLAMAA